MNVTSYADRFGLHGLTFGHEKVEQHGLVLGTHTRQRGCLAPHQHGHSLNVQWITLCPVPRFATASYCLAWIDLVDCLTTGDKALSKSSP